MASNVFGEVSNVASTFKWVIHNFCINCKNVGDSWQSPMFLTTSANSHIPLCLKLYPKGLSEKFKNYLSLYLHVKEEITASVTFKILNSKGKTAVVSTMKEKILNKNGWGYSRFVRRNFILDPANDILNDDKITIVCQINHEEPDADEDDDEDASSVEEEEDEEEKEKNYNVLQRLAEIDKYETLINDDKFSDVTLISEGKAVKVHKCILAKSSPVFDIMFNANMKEKQSNTVEITDITYDIVVEIIRFAYAGKVNNMDAIASELAAAADKYAMDGLKELCERTMCKNLSVMNVVSYLELADRYRMDNLKKKGIEIIVTHADDVTNQPEFNLLPPILLGDICRALAMNKK